VPHPLTVALFSLAVAMVVVTILVQLADRQPAPDVREVLDEGAAAAPSTDLDPGDPAPPVTFEWLDGREPTAMSELVTDPVVLNFWSSACAPCLSEMPAFDAVHRSTDGVAFVGVDVSDTEEAGTAMVERTGVSYPNARDPRGELLAAFGGVALPYTVVLDSGGTIVAEHSGALTEAELRALLHEHGLTA
jgi:thiol-disulfide isomerase/thioredoxin